MACPETIKSTTKIISEIKKSTKHTKMVLNGITILGKYTFENKLALPTIELLTSLKTFENSCHNSMADATYKKLVVVFAVLLILLEIDPKTKMLIKGLTSAHTIPAKACL